MRTASAVSLCLLVVVFTAGCVGGPLISEESTPVGSGEYGSSVVVTVVDVADGDTVDVRYDNGTTETVRLLGIDTPEVHTAVTPGEFEGVANTSEGRDCLRRWGERASGQTTKRLDGKRVTLAFDSAADRRGGYGRLLAYIIVDGENYNRQLVADGYARVYETDFSKLDQFIEAERSAQESGLGVWECRSTSA